MGGRDEQDWSVMPRHTRVYSDFVERIDEVSILRRKARKLEVSRNSLSFGPEIRALCRASVVLLSSHVEAYVKELGELTLDILHERELPRNRLSKEFFYYVTRQRIDAIRASEQPLAIAQSVEAFVETEIGFWNNAKALPSPVASVDFNKGFSNPKFEKVQQYLSRFGYCNFKLDFYRVLGRDAQQVHLGLNAIVDTRNAIAHGEASATKTPAEIMQFEEYSKKFCRVTDDVFAKWCRKNLCSIRS